MTTFFSRFLNDEHGATAIEYSIIAVLVSIAAIGALTAIGPAVKGMFLKAEAAL